MKHTLIVLFLFSIILPLQSQTIAGSYSVTGYFSHPIQQRVTKTIAQISSNIYQAELAGMDGSYSFQFSIDASNNLVNWVAVGSTPMAPASGFMTSDNPGHFIFTATPGPGIPPYIHTTYNNTYNPVTRTFYMHYGYASGSTSQNGYSRQIYEKWVLLQRQ